MRFIKAFPDGGGNCCETLERDEPCDTCARCGTDIIPDFTVSAVPVPGAYSYWTLSATNTTTNTTGDPLAWRWTVLVEIDHITRYVFKSTATDLPPKVISAACDQDVVYEISLEAVHPSVTCIKVDSFTADGFPFVDYTTISSPDLAAVFNSYDDDPITDPATDTADWNGLIYESDVGFLLGWRVTNICRDPAICGFTTFCDGLAQNPTAEAFPRVSGAQRRISYGNKTPRDPSPFGTYELVEVAFPTFTPDPPSTITIVP